LPEAFMMADPQSGSEQKIGNPLDPDLLYIHSWLKNQTNMGCLPEVLAEIQTID
jgi:hypothetical protein